MNLEEKIKRNREYWKKRFSAIENTKNRDCIKFVEDLKKEYDKSISQIEKDIRNWYSRIAVNNQVDLSNAKKMLDSKELKEFKWTLDDYIEKGKENAIDQKWVKELENASARVHIERLEAIKVQIQNELEKLYFKQRNAITSFEKQQFQNTYYRSSYEIQKGLNCFMITRPLDSKKVEKIVAKPWTTDELTFSDRIWKNKKELTETLKTELIQSIIRGENINSIINTISKKFNTAKHKAGALVMTESAFFASEGQKECFQNLGVKKYEIVATLDTHTSDICQELDGKVFDIKNYEIGITAPPFHVNCRSCTAPYFDDEFTFSDKRAYRDENEKYGLTPQNMTYKDWYKKYVEIPRENMIQPYIVGTIDKSIYENIANNVTTKDVVLLPKQIEHIEERHKGVYEKYKNEIGNILNDPDYIFKDPKHKNTALLTKKYKNNVEIVLRLNTNVNNNYKNSIITMWEIKDKRLERYKETHQIIYKKE